ncbi:MAG: hypothetical protein JWP06_1073 [Candidatus Saccharibacteria bacterium]|nr:hypothetical protein [Candidatus Saccharibacteria bacterium]
MKNIYHYSANFQDYFKANAMRRWLLILAILLLGFFIPLVALTVSVVVSYKLLLLLLNHKIFDSKFFVFIISIFFYVLVLQAVILISWLFSHNFPLTICGPLTSIVLFGLYYLIQPTISKSVRRQKNDFTPAKIKDIIPLVVCLLTFIIFVIFPIHHSGSKGISGITVLVNRVIDDPNHLGMLNDKLQFNRGVIFESNAEGHTNTKGVSFYPAGWHSANAVIIKAFYPSISTGSESLVAYAISKVFWFLFLVYLFVRTIYSLYSTYSKEKVSAVVSAWIGLASLLFVGWFLIDPFLDGFYSFLPQLIIVPIFVLSLIQMSFLNKKDGYGLLNALILPALLCMGSALSWLLLFPVFVGALLVYGFNLLYRWGVVSTLRDLLAKMPRYIFILILTLIPVIVQILTSKSTGGSVSFIQGILLPGPIQTYPTSFYEFVFLGLAIFLVLAIKNTKTDRLQPILTYITVMAAFAALLYLLQLYASQANFYYYFKSLDAFTIAASMMCVVGFAFFISWAESKTSRSTALILSFMIILLSVQFVYTKPLLFLYIQGGRATTAIMNKEIFNTLETNYSQPHYYNKEVTIYYPSSNPNMNEVASRLLSTNKPYGTCYDSVKGASFSVRPKDFDVAPILRDCADPDIKITYYVERDSLATMQKKIDENNLHERVILKLID